MLVMPAEPGWMIQRFAADATSASLQAVVPTSGALGRKTRRATFVTPESRNASRIVYNGIGLGDFRLVLLKYRNPL